MAKKRAPGSSGRRRPKRDSGEPGGGTGRVDRTGTSGIWPASAPPPEGRDMPIVTQAELGQGARGAAGAQDSGGSEIHPPGRAAEPQSKQRHEEGERKSA